MTPVEEELRALFRDQASRAPAADDLLAHVERAEGGRRRRARWWTSGGVIVAAAITAVLGSMYVLSGQQYDEQDAVTARSPASQALPSSTTPARVGPVLGLPDNGTCVIYTPDNVMRFDLAFDGTVTSIGPVVDSPRTRDDSGRVVATTFSVNEWFRGNGGKSTTLDLRVSPSIDDNRAAPFIEVGTRLLVTATRQPSTTTDGFVLGCNLTRYYDDRTAESWRLASLRE
jgi:hypothetical protein